MHHSTKAQSSSERGRSPRLTRVTRQCSTVASGSQNRVQLAAMPSSSRAEGLVRPVAEVEEAPRAVLGELLLPAGERRELRVVDPREAAAGLAHREADARGGDQVDPRPRRARLGDVEFAAVFGEVAVRSGERRGHRFELSNHDVLTARRLRLRAR
jgi:hypothetical protein